MIMTDLGHQVSSLDAWVKSSIEVGLKDHSCRHELDKAYGKAAWRKATVKPWGTWAAWIAWIARLAWWALVGLLGLVKLTELTELTKLTKLTKGVS